MLLGAGFVLGAASTAFVQAAEVALVDVAGDRLDRLVARVDLLAAVGDLLGPLTLVVLSWPAAFLVGAAVMAAYSVLLAAAPLPLPKPVPEHVPAVSLWRDTRVWRLGLAAMVLGLFDEPFFAFAIVFAREACGDSARTAQLIVAAAVVGELAGIAWVNRRPVTRPTGSAVALAVAVAAFAVAPAAPLRAIAACVVGAAMSVAWVALHTRMLGLRPGQAGAVSAVVSTVELLAIGFPLGVGLLADASGVAVAFGAYVGVAALLPVVVAGATREANSP